MPILIKKTYSSLPAPFTVTEGGLYIGNFFPGSPANTIGSDLLGNTKTGSAKVYKSEITGVGDRENMWAIILATKDYSSKNSFVNSFRGNSESRINWLTSNYDGLYNKSIVCNFNEFLQKNVNYGGYKDWYVPSVNELAFIAKNLPIGYYIPNRFSAMNKTVYRSSSVSKFPEANQITQNYNYNFFGQSFNKTKYGAVYHVSEFSSTPIRLIRRVNLIEYKG